MKTYPYLSLVVSAILINQVLFFLDEGYNDFRWVQSFGNWIVFAGYTIVLFGAQFLVFSVLRKRWDPPTSILASIAGGTTLLFGFIFLFYSLVLVFN
jgi:hypothetical protein